MPETTIPLTMTDDQRARFLTMCDPIPDEQDLGDELCTILGADTFEAVTTRLRRLLAHRRPVVFQHRYHAGDLEVHPLMVPATLDNPDAENNNWHTDTVLGYLSWHASYARDPMGRETRWLSLQAAEDVTAAEQAARAMKYPAVNGYPIGVTRVTMRGGRRDAVCYGDHVIVETLGPLGGLTWTRIDFHDEPAHI